MATFSKLAKAYISLKCAGKVTEARTKMNLQLFHLQPFPQSPFTVENRGRINQSLMTWAFGRRTIEKFFLCKEIAEKFSGLAVYGII